MTKSRSKSSRRAKVAAKPKAPAADAEEEKVTGFKEGRWDDDEHDRFIVAMADFVDGNNAPVNQSARREKWGAIAAAVGTRSTLQCRSHAQKHYIKEKKQRAPASAAVRIGRFFPPRARRARTRPPRRVVLPRREKQLKVVKETKKAPAAVHRVTPQPSMSNSPEPSIHGSRLDLSEGFVAGDTAANLEEAVRILSPPRPPGRLARLRPSALTAEALFSPSGGPVDVEHGSPRPDVERASPRPAIVDDAEDEALRLFDSPVILSQPSSPKIYDSDAAWAKVMNTFTEEVDFHSLPVF
mmetsp:Transcript_16316/g.53128  ORF Transcript_16316/g.53128 Transcript_16316/m.53128 type:complete len:297 (+) Transcript_16316:74-964(+)